jgi:tRNA threonylcarbamoyl adenosine modification protein YeaZ
VGRGGLIVSVLAIDTSSRSRVVCVLASPDGGLLDAEVVRGEAVSASLPRVLDRLLGRADHAVVVVTGPGTYTGVRAGMAAALGIAHARGLPLHGVGSLEVIASAGPQAASDDWVVTDAGRGALYVARAADAEHPVRIALAAFDAAGANVFSSDVIDISGLIQRDPADALARAVSRALSRPALDPSGLTALYVD